MENVEVKKAREEDPVVNAAHEQLKRDHEALLAEMKEVVSRNRFLENQAFIVRLNFLFEVVKGKDVFPLSLRENALLEIDRALYPRPGGDVNEK